MGNDIYLTAGRSLFALALIGLGLLQILSGHFNDEIFPVAAWFPGGIFFAYLNGFALMAAGILTASNKYCLSGALISGVIFLMFLLFLHIPKLVMNLTDSGEWTSTAENFMFLSGALMLTGNAIAGNNTNKAYKIFLTGKYIFALTLFDFGVEHWISEPFVVSIIPAWIPWKAFWAYFVMAAFFTASVSLFINKKVRLAALLIFLMFFLFIALLHLPDAAENIDTVFSWTNLFVPIGVCGSALVLAGLVVE